VRDQAAVWPVLDPRSEAAADPAEHGGQRSLADPVVVTAQQQVDRFPATAGWPASPPLTTSRAGQQQARSATPSAVSIFASSSASSTRSSQVTAL